MEKRVKSAEELRNEQDWSTSMEAFMDGRKAGWLEAASVLEAEADEAHADLMWPGNTETDTGLKWAESEIQNLLALAAEFRVKAEE